MELNFTCNIYTNAHVYTYIVKIHTYIHVPVCIVQVDLVHLKLQRDKKEKHFLGVESMPTYAEPQWVMCDNDVDTDIEVWKYPLLTPLVKTYLNILSF